MEFFLIYANRQKDRELAVTGRIRRYLEDRGRQVAVRTGQDVPTGDSPAADCMIVLGGDGTVLQAVRETGNLHIPIIEIGRAHV